METVNQKLLNELQVGETFSGTLLMVSMKQDKAKTGNADPYIDFILADSSGQINGKMWNTSDNVVTEKRLIEVNATVTEFRNVKQLKLANYKILESGQGDLSKFIKMAPVSTGDMRRKIIDTLEKVSDEQLKKITANTLKRVWERIDSAPAAKEVHHAYYGGLLYHITRMLGIADFLVSQRPWLNQDLLRCAIILHDICKIEEMESDMGIVSDYTDQGKLIGHISMCAQWVMEEGMKLGLIPSDEKLMLLQHMILSHHGKGEWGSPVAPQIPEAVALHWIDQLDAKMQCAEDAYVDLEPGTWSAPMLGLDRARLYKPKE